VIELVVLSLLTFGYNLKRHNKHRQHGITMATALVLHLVTIFSVMIWSLMSFFLGSPVDFGNLLHLTALAHATIGIIAASLGVWLVAAWHFQTNVQKCFARKRIMVTAIALWLVAITLGIILYFAVIYS
jgi:hypothetical protein